MGACCGLLRGTLGLIYAEDSRESFVNTVHSRQQKQHLQEAGLVEGVFADSLEQNTKKQMIVALENRLEIKYDFFC